MKLSHIIIILMTVILTITTLAQKQPSINNEDPRVSLEATIPDSLNTYEYNEKWLDSIPYLMEHVRNCEPWAYENLARCYRFGIGVEKSITNAMIYYDKAGINVQKLAENAYISDPTDELGFTNYLIEGLSKNRMTIEDALELLNSYPAPLPSWAVCMKRIFNNRNIEDIKAYIKSSIDLNTITADELFTSFLCLCILDPDSPTFASFPSNPEFLTTFSLVAEKIPLLYLNVGHRYWAMYENCPNDEQAMRNAFEMYHKAYLNGLLDAGGAVEVLDFSDTNQLYNGFPFSSDELAHLDGFYSKEYRIRYKSPCSDEEGIVEEAIVEEAIYEESPEAHE